MSATTTYGSSVSAVEPYGTEQIPHRERHGHPSQQFTLWFTANMVLAVLVTGFFAESFGLTVLEGLSAVALGSAAGALVMGLLAGIGTRMGVPQQVQARGPMGYFANFVPITLLTVVSAVGWTAVNTVFAVIALRVIVDVPFWLGAAVMFLVQGLLAVWGYNLIHLINRIASVVLAVLFGVITWMAVTEVDVAADVGGDVSHLTENFGGWLTFATFFFAYVMTWTPFASDFSRYLPQNTSHAKVTGYTAAGTFLAMLWLGGIGVLVSSFTGELGAVEAVIELTGPLAPVAMVTIVLSTIPVSSMNLYGGALSLLTIHVPVSRTVGVAITAAAGFLLALAMQTDPYGSFYDFLNLLAYLVVPFSTVLLLDFYLRMRRGTQDSTDQLFDRSRWLHWGFWAWLIGCAVSALFWSTSLFTGPFAGLSDAVGDLGYLAGALGATIAYLMMYFSSGPPRTAADPTEHASNLEYIR